MQRFKQLLQTGAVAYTLASLALAGTAYAAATVGSGDVVNNSLRSADLRDGAAVRGVDVVDNSIGGADVNEASMSGLTIVARARSTTDQTTSGSLTVYPMASNAFTQAANESITAVVVRAQFDAPAGCSGPTDFLTFLFKLDGSTVLNLSFAIGAAAADKVVTNAPALGSVQFEPGVATPRTLTVEISDGCGAGDVHVDSLGVDVVGLR